MIAHFVEFAERGSLYDFIHHNKLDPERNLKWARGIASGMAVPSHVSSMVTGALMQQYHEYIMLIDLIIIKTLSTLTIMRRNAPLRNITT